MFFASFLSDSFIYFQELEEVGSLNFAPTKIQTIDGETRNKNVSHRDLMTENQIFDGEVSLKFRQKSK